MPRRRVGRHPFSFCLVKFLASPTVWHVHSQTTSAMNARRRPYLSVSDCRLLSLFGDMLRKLVFVKAKILDQTVKIRPIHAEDPGRFCMIPRGLIQRVLD